MKMHFLKIQKRYFDDIKKGFKNYIKKLLYLQFVKLCQIFKKKSQNAKQ